MRLGRDHRGDLQEGRGDVRQKLNTLRPGVRTLDMTRGAPVTERIRGHELVKIRERILLRDGYRCRVCGRVGTDLEVDHITPLHMGGQETDANRQSICAIPCHRDKTEREEKERDNKIFNDTRTIR